MPSFYSPTALLSRTPQPLSPSTRNLRIKHPIHGLVRQLHPQKCRRIRRHRPRQRRPNPRKKRLHPPTPINTPDHPPDRRPPLRALQPRLHGIDREHRDPHRHARGPSRRHHRREAQIARGFPVRVFGRHFPLYVLVGREVCGASGAVTRERHYAPAEDAADAAFAVELPDDVESAGILGLFVGGEGLLALDLEEHFYALEGGGYERHGDGGEEACGGHLGDGEGLVGGGCGREAPDEGFADVVALGGMSIVVGD